MEQWEKNYYISSIAGAVNGSSLVVMSKGLIITPLCNIYSFMTCSTSFLFVLSMGFSCTIYYLGIVVACLSLSPLPSP